MNERNDKMRKDEFKMNFFFDENGPTFEEIVMEYFEEKILEIIEKNNLRFILHLQRQMLQ